MENTVALCGGTDGTDGPTDAAGGVVNGMTIAEGEKSGLQAREFLENNDAYNFLSRTGELLVTGPTNTNVMDLRVFIVS